MQNHVMRYCMRSHETAAWYNEDTLERLRYRRALYNHVAREAVQRSCGIFVIYDYNEVEVATGVASITPPAPPRESPFD